MARLIGALLSAAVLAETAHANGGHKGHHHKVKTQYHKPSSDYSSSDGYESSQPIDNSDLTDPSNTYPNNPRAPIGDLNTFYFFADWGHPDDTRFQQLIAQAMNAECPFLAKGRPDFIIAAGDNFYNNGVRNTSDSKWEVAWNQIYTYACQQVPFYSVFGNHDYYFPIQVPGTLEGTYDSTRTGSPEVEIQFYQENALANRVDEAKPGFITGRNRWIFPEHHYTRTYRLGNSGKTAEFFYFDTVRISAESGGIDNMANSPSSANYTGTAEIDWLENALRTSTADWKIPVGHYPLFCPSAVHGDNPDLIIPLEPMFRRYGVRFYINGHDHIMSSVEYKGIKYITNGAGGKSLYAEKFPYRPFYADARELFSVQLFGFLQFTFSQDATQVKLVVHKAGNSSAPLSTYFPGQPGAVAWTDIIYLNGDKNEPNYNEGFTYNGVSTTSVDSEKFEYKINSENPVPFTDPHEHESMEMEPPMEVQQVDQAPEEEEPQPEEESADKGGRRARVMGRIKNAQA